MIEASIKAVFPYLTQIITININKKKYLKIIILVANIIIK
jgi:hypothetical protein